MCYKWDCKEFDENAEEGCYVDYCDYGCTKDATCTVWDNERSWDCLRDLKGELLWDIDDVPLWETSDELAAIRDRWENWQDDPSQHCYDTSQVLNCSDFNSTDDCQIFYNTNTCDLFNFTCDLLQNDTVRDCGADLKNATNWFFLS